MHCIYSFMYRPIHLQYVIINIHFGGHLSTSTHEISAWWVKMYVGESADQFWVSEAQEMQRMAYSTKTEKKKRKQTNASSIECTLSFPCHAWTSESFQRAVTSCHNDVFFPKHTGWMVYKFNFPALVKWTETTGKWKVARFWKAISTIYMIYGEWTVLVRPNVLSHYIKLWSRSLMSCVLLHICPLFQCHVCTSPAGWPPPIRRTRSPRRSAAPKASVHRGQTQWESSAEETKTKGEKQGYVCGTETKCTILRDITTHQRRQQSHFTEDVAWLILSDASSTANQTYGTDIWKHCFQLQLPFTLFFCPDSSRIEFHRPYMKQAESADREWDRMGWGVVAWHAAICLLGRSIESRPCLSSPPASYHHHQLAPCLTHSLPVCLSYYSDESLVSPLQNAFPHANTCKHTYSGSHSHTRHYGKW